MRKTGDKWGTKKCRVCGESHSGFSGKMDSEGNEYVICRSLKILLKYNEDFVKEDKKEPTNERIRE